MVNYIFIAVGQCGNQLTYELLNLIYLHCLENLPSTQQSKAYSAKKRGSSKGSAASATARPYFNQSIHKSYYVNDDDQSYKDDILGQIDESQQLLYDSVFRQDISSEIEQVPSSSRKRMSTARVICFDTEPKVIENCINKAKYHFSHNSIYSWHYDLTNVAYRHSGAGNNWALGYSMASGDFLETTIDIIRKEVERSDDLPILVYLHSLAGGTGSGLGTHLIESVTEEFPDLYHYNILISPHSFSEVIVQHYNALLCISKIYQHSNGILIFENENAQRLCKQMKCIDKPLLYDLNQTIASHLIPLFLPKIQTRRQEETATTNETNQLSTGKSVISRRTSRTTQNQTPKKQKGGLIYTSLADDLTYLCSNPTYKFFNVKITPQTSIDSIDFTYDSWLSLINTIQRMQLSGTLSEREIRLDVKSIGRQNYDGSGGSSSLYSRSSSRRGTSSRRSGRSTSHDTSSVAMDSLAEIREEGEVNDEGERQIASDQQQQLSELQQMFANEDIEDWDLDGVARVERERDLMLANLMHRHPYLQKAAQLFPTEAVTTTTGGKKQIFPKQTVTTASNNAPPLIKSLASIISFHGEESSEAIDQLQAKDTSIESAGRGIGQSHYSSFTSANNSIASKSMAAYINSQNTRPQFYEEFLTSHSKGYFYSNQCQDTFLLDSKRYGNHSQSIHLTYSNFYLNQYKRSTSVISNDQSILPLLSRILLKSSEMYQAKAYIHQYLSHGLENDDFVEAFQNMGSIIQNYADL